jgi:uncharacterized membrane protein (UPF0127 family)
LYPALWSALAVAGLLGAACGSDDDGAEPALETITFESGADLQVEIADEPAERETGLMFRTELDEDRGMLFIYEEEQTLSFWMRNTYIPLSIAYVAADGTIVNILDMEPFDETTHPSSGPAQYAIEANQGWFAQNGVDAGQKVDLEAALP